MGAGLSLALSIGVPLAGGFIGSLVSTPDVLTWYQDIKKPKWTPPSFIFGPMWTVMYIAQGTASWFVLRNKGANRTLPLALYAVQLAFNMAWNPIFFKTHKTDVATADAAAILGFATAATVAMTKASSPAIQLPLMVPYLCWVAFATALSARICQLNPTERLYQYNAIDSKTDAKLNLKNDPTAASKDPAPKPVTDIMKEATTAATQAVQAAKSGADAVKSGKQS